VTQTQQQATDKDGLLNSIFVRGKNLIYNSPQEKMKGGVTGSCPKTSDEEREKEEKSKEYLVMTVVKTMVRHGLGRSSEHLHPLWTGGNGEG
jgi:hypothetical protein